MKVLGHRVLVKVKPVEEKSQGGIIVTTQLNKDKERLAKEEGEVVGIGSTAYKGLGEGDAWVSIGDIVYFQRYGGIAIKDGEDDFRILNDEDILAIK